MRFYKNEKLVNQNVEDVSHVYGCGYMLLPHGVHLLIGRNSRHFSF